MDKSAIQQIQQQVSVSSIQAALDDSEPCQPLLALPEGFKVHELERSMPTRRRFRGSMATHVLPAFADYAKKHGKDESVCFVDSDSMRATVVFDMGSDAKPLHCEHTSTITLKKLAAFKAVLSMDGAHVNQKALAEWIEDWREFIAVFDAAGTVIETGVAVAAVRRLKIEQTTTSNHEVQNMRASRSALEEIEATSETGLPASIRFLCSPYECIVARAFDMSLSIITSHSNPEFSLRIKQLETHEEEMTWEFLELVKIKLESTPIELFVGSFSS